MSIPDSPETAARRLRRARLPSRFDLDKAGVRVEKVALPLPGTMSCGVESGTEYLMMMSSYSQSAFKESSSKKVYVGSTAENGEGLAAPLEHKELLYFFNSLFQLVLRDVDGVEGKNSAVTRIKMNPVKQFAFVEFHTEQLASVCIDMDGVIFRNAKLKIRRPSDYVVDDNKTTHNHGLKLNVIGIPGLGDAQENKNSAHRVFVGGLPYTLLEPQLTDLLQAFGPLKSLHLVKEAGVSERSKGYAFCEWEDPSVTEVAVKGLNGLEIQGKPITIKLSNSLNTAKTDGPGQNTTSSPENVSHDSMDINAALAAAGVPCAKVSPKTQSGNSYILTSAETPTRFVMLSNMVTKEELADDEEYADIILDIEEECRNFGELLNLKLPRAGNYAGKTFLVYKEESMAIKAKVKLDGRQFGEALVSAAYVAEEVYLST